MREDTDCISDFTKNDGVLRNRCSSVHLILNLLWLNGVKNITTLGITQSHSNWGITKEIVNLYGMKAKRLEDGAYIS